MDEDWAVSPITRRFKDKAWAQLGTSGSGNHFVEFGAMDVNAQPLVAQPHLVLAHEHHGLGKGSVERAATALHLDLGSALRPAEDDGGARASVFHGCVLP